MWRFVTGMKEKKVVIVGAGPGGLTAGYDPCPAVGSMSRSSRSRTGLAGRNAELKVGDYSFDTGPTFLHQKFTLDEVFEEGRREGG